MEKKKEITFHPKISEKSKKLVKENRKPIEDQLIEYGNLQKKNILKKQYERRLNEMKQNTYCPSIDKSSRLLGNINKRKRIEIIQNNLSEINDSCIKMNDNNSINSNRRIDASNKLKKNIHSTNIYNSNYSNKKSRSKTPIKSSKYNSDESFTSFNINNKVKNFEIKPESNLFDYLYFESKIIKKKNDETFKMKFEQEYPFKPTISKNTNNMLKNRKETKGEFIKKLGGKKNEYEEIIILPNKKNQFEKTNEKISNFPNKDLDMNYNKNALNQIINNENNDLIQKGISNSMIIKQTYLKNTAEIILNTKIRKIQQIFNMLDSDQDGFISCESIKLSNLNEKLLSVLTPFIEELYSNKENLTFRDFYDKVEPILSNNFF